MREETSGTRRKGQGKQKWERDSGKERARKTEWKKRIRRNCTKERKIVEREKNIREIEKPRKKNVDTNKYKERIKGRRK